jgi:hypothetical protein
MIPSGLSAPSRVPTLASIPLNVAPPIVTEPTRTMGTSIGLRRLGSPVRRRRSAGGRALVAAY